MCIDRQLHHEIDVIGADYFTAGTFHIGPTDSLLVKQRWKLDEAVATGHAQQLISFRLASILHVKELLILLGSSRRHNQSICLVWLLTVLRGIVSCIALLHHQYLLRIGRLLIAMKSSALISDQKELVLGSISVLFLYGHD